MTFDPTTNRIEFQLLTPEEQKALMAWPHGWEGHAAGVWYDAENPNWDGYVVYRGKPAPVVKILWVNIYPYHISGSYQRREYADRFAGKDRIAVLRIDTCNGKRTYTEEPL